jgi:hypothetical protein
MSEAIGKERALSRTIIFKDFPHKTLCKNQAAKADDKRHPSAPYDEKVPEGYELEPKGEPSACRARQ